MRAIEVPGLVMVEAWLLGVETRHTGGSSKHDRSNRAEGPPSAGPSVSKGDRRLNVGDFDG